MENKEFPEFEGFEEDTGFVPPPELDKQEAKESKEIVGDGELLRGLKSHSGWKVLETFLNCERESLLKQLVIETDLKKIRRIQCMSQTLGLLPTLIDKVLFDAEKAKRILDSYIQDEPDNNVG